MEKDQFFIQEQSDYAISSTLHTGSSIKDYSPLCVPDKETGVPSIN